MPSTYSTSLRVELQAAGENLNTWGAPKLNAALQRLEDAVAGRTTFTLSGTKTLSSANGSSDEAREMMLDITSGTGGTVTIPAVSKMYLVRNNTSGSVIITTGGATNATVVTTETTFVMCDGANCYLVSPKQYADSILILAKAYTDSIAVTAGSLPGSVGLADYVLMTQNVGSGGGSPQFFSPSSARSKLGLPSPIAMSIIFGG